jgi:hypothetical protein
LHGRPNHEGRPTEDHGCLPATSVAHPAGKQACRHANLTPKVCMQTVSNDCPLMKLCMFIACAACLPGPKRLQYRDMMCGGDAPSRTCKCPSKEHGRLPELQHL